MSLAQLPYNPPGVSVQEVSSPSVNTSLSSTNTVALVGPVQGYTTETQQITIPSGVASFNIVTLTSGNQFVAQGANQQFISVTNAVTPSLGNAPNQGGYAQGIDFSVVVNSSNNVATVTPIFGETLAAGGIINFTYAVIPANYFYATQFGSQSSIESLYGPAYAAGGIQTPLSAGAAQVMNNGMTPLILQPLFVLSNPNDPTSQRLQPTQVEMANPTTWQQTLYALRSVQGINFVVPIFGQSFAYMNDSTELAILQTVQDHIYYMETSSSPNEYIFGVFGEDSTTNSSYALDATLQTHAATLQSRYGNAVSQNLILLVPGSFGMPNPSTTSSNNLLNIGAEYVAAGYAGMIASRSVSTPTTRQPISGVQQVNSYRDLVTKNADAQAGLTVLEQNQQTVQIRHAITLDNTSIENRELSVVRAKFFMISSLIEALDSQVVGQIPADGNATTIVSLVVTSVLNSLQAAGALVSYGNVQTQLLASNPTTCEIRFSWTPLFPVNNIDVVFSLDLSGLNGITNSTTNSVSS